MSDANNISRPKVSVIIVNYNGARYLERCLQALRQQVVAPHEIIIVDNASSDNSIEIVRNFPEVKWLPQNQNLGFARGNNVGVAATDLASEWIALLNGDAFAEPEWLMNLLVATQQFPEFDAFACKLLNAANPAILDGQGDAYHISGRAFRIGFGKPVPDHQETCHEVFSPCAAAALYRRSAFDKIGGFDEQFFCYLEDVDLGFRLRLAGYRCLYVPSSVAQHVGSGSTGGQHSDFSAYHGHRNLVWTYVKDMPSVLFWFFLPLHLLMNIAGIVKCAMRGQLKVVLRAKWDALLGLPEMWGKRRQIQQNRSTKWNELLRVLSMLVSI